MKRTLIVCGLMIALGACAALPLVPPSETVVVVQTGTTVDLAYNATAKAYKGLLPTMPPSVHDTVKPLLLKAYQAVQAADTAEALGNATDMQAQITIANALITEIKTTLGIK